MKKHPQYYGLLYKTTNLVNGKLYIGQTIRIERYLKGKYIGSGFAFKEAIKKYGLQNFKSEILQYLEHQPTEEDSIQKLNDLEIHYIKEYDSLVPNGYNLEDGGKGKGETHPTTKEKISQSLKGNIRNRGRKQSSQEIENRAKSLKGRVLSKETKEKISKSLQGRKFSETTLQKMRGKVRTQEHKERISLTLKSKGFSTKGRKLSEEVKLKLSLIKKNLPQRECPYCKVIGRGGNMTRYHFDKCVAKV